VVAGVQEDHVDARSDLRGDVREHPVTHRRRDREPLAERRYRPLDDHLGRGQLELGAGVADELLELRLAASFGAGALELAGGVGGYRRH
jgi:hypothetical protein